MGDPTDWKAKAIELQQEVEEIKKELDDYQESSALLEKEQENENKELARQLKEERGKRTRIEQELDKLKERLSSTSDSSKSQVTSMQTELQHLRSENQHLSKSLRDIEQKNDELEESLRRAASSLENVQADIYAKIEENEFLKTDIEERTDTERQLREEIKDLHAALEVNHSHLDRLRHDSSPMKQSSSLENDASEQLQISQALLDEQTLIASSHARRIQELEEDMSKKTAEIEKLKASLHEALSRPTPLPAATSTVPPNQFSSPFTTPTKTDRTLSAVTTPTRGTALSMVSELLQRVNRLETTLSCRTVAGKTPAATPV